MAKERRDSKNRLLWKGEYQKKDGRYMYRYVDAKGESRFVYSWTLTSTDRTPKGKEPGLCLRDLEKKIAQDINDEIDIFTAKKQTVNSFFEKYMEQKKGLKPTTRRNYRYQYDTFVKDTIGNKKLADVKYSDIRKLYNDLIYEKGLKISAVMNLNIVLNPVFKLAVRDNIIRKNPVAGVYIELKNEVDELQSKRHALTVKQQKALVKYVESHNRYNVWHSLIVFLLGTGCRIGEACGITWSDLDFKRDIIKIERTLSYYPDEHTGKCRFLIQKPKSNAGFREIPMLPEVKKVLLDEKKRQLLDGFCKVEIGGVSGFVFMTSRGNAIAPRTFNYALDKIVESFNSDEKLIAIGQHREPDYIPDISPHIFRHTFCTRLCENEINVKVIQGIMGHSCISVTMDIYNDLTDDFRDSEFKQFSSKFKIC